MHLFTRSACSFSSLWRCHCPHLLLRAGRVSAIAKAGKDKVKRSIAALTRWRALVRASSIVKKLCAIPTPAPREAGMPVTRRAGAERAADISQLCRGGTLRPRSDCRIHSRRRLHVSMSCCRHGRRGAATRAPKSTLTLINQQIDLSQNHCINRLEVVSRRIRRAQWGRGRRALLPRQP